MRFFVAILFLMALPMTAMSQQIPTPASYPRIQGSLKNGVIQSAPDISPGLEEQLKHNWLQPMSSETTILEDFHAVRSGVKPPVNSSIQVPLHFKAPFLQKSQSDPSELIGVPDSFNALKLWEPVNK